MCCVYTTDYYLVIKKNKNHKIFRKMDAAKDSNPD